MTISATTQGLRMGVATSTSRPTVPFDGQVISETDTDSLQVYKGTAWAPVSGLQYITGASFTTAATVSFAAGVFTSTYKNYVVYLNCDTAASGTVNIRVNVAGVPATGTSYYSGYTTRGSGAAANAGSNTTSMTLGPTIFGAYNLNSVITCFNPQTSSGQYDNNITATSTSFWDTANIGVSLMGGGTDSIGAYDGLTFTSSTTITGTYKVYGLANS